MAFTFGLVVIGWVFFRADTITEAFDYLQGMVQFGTLKASYRFFTEIAISPLIVAFVVIEWLGREQQYALAKLGLTWKAPWRYALYFALVLAIAWFGGEEQQFIYFQF